MPEILTDISGRADKYTGKRLVRLLIILFAVFLVVGLSVGAVINRYTELNTPKNTELTPSGAVPEYYVGTITYIEPLLHPEDKISYVLVGPDGSDVILLKADDQKLEVSEGHKATVYGRQKKTVEGEPYLLVEKIVIKNAPN